MLVDPAAANLIVIESTHSAGDLLLDLDTLPFQNNWAFIHMRIAPFSSTKGQEVTGRQDAGLKKR
jgi:hypothetical protein